MQQEPILTQNQVDLVWNIERHGARTLPGAVNPFSTAEAGRAGQVVARRPNVDGSIPEPRTNSPVDEQLFGSSLPARPPGLSLKTLGSLRGALVTYGD